MTARKKIVLSFLISTILIAVLKLSFPVPRKFSDSFWIKKTHSNEKFDLVVCGDSRVYRSFSIDALQSKLDFPIRGVNLGYLSAGYSNEYLDFAVSKFDSDSKQKILVLGISPHSLTQEAFKNEHFKSFMNMTKNDVYKGLKLSSLYKFFSPYKPSELFVNNNNVKTTYHSDGWVSTSWIKADTLDGMKVYKRTFSNYQVDKRELNVFLKKLGEIKAKGITIIAYRPPSTVQMRNLEDSISGFKEQTIKKELVKRNIIWFDFKDSDFHSYDGSHLDSKSAEKFSELFGQKMNELHLVKKK